MFVIEDNIHCEGAGHFERFEDAIAELKRRAAIAWDQPPNKAPALRGERASGEYEVYEFDVSHEPWKLLCRVKVLTLSSKGVEWATDFEQA